MPVTSNNTHSLQCRDKKIKGKREEYNTSRYIIGALNHQIVINK